MLSTVVHQRSRLDTRVRVAAGQARDTGPEPVCQISRSQRTVRREPETCSCRDQQTAEAGCVQTAGADCGDLRWATVGLDSSEEGSGGLSPERRSGGRLERRPVSTWVDDRELRKRPRIKWSQGPESLLARASPGRRRLSRSAGAAAVRLGCRSCRSLLWGSHGGTLITCALSAPGGVSPVRAIS
jgi:hypothetical protein